MANELPGYVYDVWRSRYRRAWWAGCLRHKTTGRTLCVADAPTRDQLVDALNARYAKLKRGEEVTADG